MKHMRDGLTSAGFTLIELLAVIVIIGILATVLVSSFGPAQATAEVGTTRQRLAMLDATLEAYNNEFGAYTTLQTDTR